MEYKTLPNIRDQYPAGPEFVDDSFSIPPPPEKNIDDVYETKGPTSVKVTGKYAKNFLYIDTEPLDNIDILELNVPAQPNGPTPITFRFIVEFINNDGSSELWTSPPFYNDLVAAKQEDNPYFSLNRVTIVRLNFSELSNYWKKSEFTIKQNYAEVQITDTINTKEDMLIHINWMVSSSDDLRSVRGGTDPFGDWVLKTSDSFGFEYSDQLRDSDQGTRGRSNQDVGAVRQGDNVTVREQDSSTPRSNQDVGAVREGDDVTVREQDGNRSNQDTGAVRTETDSGSTRTGSISTNTDIVGSNSSTRSTRTR